MYLTGALNQLGLRSRTELIRIESALGRDGG
jgi:hypothetical protein